jgi:fructokinase
MLVRFGIDLGGSKTEIIALDVSGTEIYRKRVDTDPTSYEAIVTNIARLVIEAESTLGRKGTVGVGIPGTISARTGCVKNANTNVLNGHPLHRDLSRCLNREVRSMNDANCLALSEAVDGAGAGYRVVFAVILGTGCGAGIAIDGKPWAGVNRLARSLSHAVNILDPDVVVLGGGMSNVDELYDWVPPQLASYVFGGEAETPIVRNKHGDSSGVRGAAWLWPRC